VNGFILLVVYCCNWKRYPSSEFYDSLFSIY